MPPVYDTPLVLFNDVANDLWNTATDRGTGVERALSGTLLRFLQGMASFFRLDEFVNDVVEGVTDDILAYVEGDAVLSSISSISEGLEDAHEQGMLLDTPDNDLRPTPSPRVPDGPPRPPTRFVSSAGVPGGVDTSTRRGEAWARQRAASLVTDITQQQRDVVRQAVAESLRQSEGLVGLENRLRNAGLGLTQRDQGAVLRYERRLLADGLPPGSARSLSSQYATRLLNNRAQTIARTETFTALNRGRIDLWSDAVKRGDLPATARKVWVTAMDERVCPYCAPLDGITALIVEPFDLEPSRHTEGDISHPPLHPNCRCLVMLSME